MIEERPLEHRLADSRAAGPGANSSSVKRSCWTYSSAGPRPAAMVKPDLKGGAPEHQVEDGLAIFHPCPPRRGGHAELVEVGSSESGCP